MAWVLQQYEDSRGFRPVEKFLETLPLEGRAVLKARLYYLQERGNRLREPHTKSLGDRLFELRVRSYRVFFCFKPGNRIVLLHAFIKKSQSTPRKELDLARSRQREV